MSASNVPTLTISATGVSVPSANDVFNGAMADINGAFGGNLNTQTVGTPQYTLASDETAYLTAANAAMAFLCGQVDPSTAEGRFQDAIGRIYYIARNPATATVVTCTCTGTPGAVLPIGALATDGTNIYQSTANATFGSGGTVSVQFACTTLGPITCNANALNQIVSIPAGSGWDAVTNPSAGVVGNAVETQAAFEFRRQNSTANNANGTPAAVLAAVINVSGVIDCYVLDNPTGANVNVGATNYSMVKNSLLVSVVGGASAAIANAIFNKKGPGCNMNGNTSVTVTDTNSLANPQPTYSITYLVPTNTPIYFIVNISNNANLPADIVTRVQNAVIAAFTGTDGGARARIASLLAAGRYYAGVQATSSYVAILSIYLGQAASPTGTSTTMGVDQVPTIQASNITVNLV